MTPLSTIMDLQNSWQVCLSAKPGEGGACWKAAARACLALCTGQILQKHAMLAPPAQGQRTAEAPRGSGLARVGAMLAVMA